MRLISTRLSALVRHLCDKRQRLEEENRRLRAERNLAREIVRTIARDPRPHDAQDMARRYARRWFGPDYYWKP